MLESEQAATNTPYNSFLHTNNWLQMITSSTTPNRYQGCHKGGKSQEKSRNQEKVGVFEKKSGSLTKKKTGFVSLNLRNSLFSKAFKW